MRFGEDTVFVAEVCELERSNSAAVTGLPLYYYAQREGSAGKTADTELLFQFGNTWLGKLASSQRDDIYLDKALRWYLPIRYESTHITPDREAVHESNEKLKLLRGYLWKSRIYGFVEKTAYLVFCFFPGIYWLHRIIGDPSMLQWEKMQRKKRREEKKKSNM